MKHGVKKQIWLTNAENNLLQKYSAKTCLTEAEYIRMLLRGRIPKEKPDAEFYEVMNQISQFLGTASDTHGPDGARGKHRYRYFAGRNQTLASISAYH